MTDQTTLKIFMQQNPVIKSADNRGYFISTATSGVWYLYDDGLVRHGANYDGASAFWPSEETAFHFWEVWQYT